MGQIYPVVLSGGIGSRLWPLSRSQMPKQLMPILSPRSMLQETVLRIAQDRMQPPIVISNTNHRFIIAAQLQELGVATTAHILEPVGRNTAAAAAVAARIIADREEKGIVLLLPADHHIADINAFNSTILAGANYANAGYLVTFGVTPASPEVGYGYIRRGQPLDAGEGFAVDGFFEKPDLARARAFLDSGSFFWNSGIFMCRADILLKEMQLHCPDILSRATAAVSGSYRDLDFIRLDEASFEACPSEAIDTAVLERTKNAAVLQLDAGWSDIGSWAALWDLAAKDPSGNVISGDVIAVDTTNTYIRSDGRLITALGVSGLVIIDAGDAVMIADKSRVQDVRGLVDKLRALGRAEHESHSRVHRPWGFYELIQIGERYQVKHLMVKPEGTLSLQMHHHRAEHWVIVRGTARVTLGNETSLVTENESVFIPIGATHRLENPGKVPLSIIEVQSGSYLGEDDITRFEDSYGRKEYP